MNILGKGKLPIGAASVNAERIGDYHALRVDSTVDLPRSRSASSLSGRSDQRSGGVSELGARSQRRRYV